QPVPSVEAIAATIHASLAELFPEDVELYLEPGRYLVGTSAILVANVIGTAERDGERWAYLDVGVFNGLMETIAQNGGFDYEIQVLKSDDHADRPIVQQVVAGPTCDSMDVMFVRRLLPELRTGDRVLLMNVGAYTLSYA